MRAIYFDCFAGASGDMVVGALIDIGLDPQYLKQQLARLGVGGYELAVSRVARSAVAAARFEVKLSAVDQPPRHLPEIRRLIGDSPLPDRVRSRAITVFERLAEAEARVHDTTVDEVHFHEVGAVDSIVDIVGAMIGFEWLAVERFFASPLRVGHGVTTTQHGQLPVPAPATVELLRGVPLYGGDLEGEFVTPTGAAILATLCEGFGPIPPMRIERVGHGAGARDPENFPNALRVFLGEVMSQTRTGDEPPDQILVVETNIDDMNPQIYESVMERALALGALDVLLTPVQMKKNRPGVMLTALCEPASFDAVARLLLSETTSLGLRYYPAGRRVLNRRVAVVETPYGAVRVKVALDGERALHFQAEYDDCLRLADQAGVPLLEVQAAAAAACREKLRAASEGERTK